MKHYPKLVFAVLVFAVGVTPHAGGADAAKDQKDIQGAWLPTAENPLLMGIKFEGNKFEADTPDGIIKGTFKLDADSNPRTIDLTVEDPANAQLQGKISLGIYKFEGGKLIWCANAPGRPNRPSRFASEEGGERLLFVELKKK